MAGFKSTGTYSTRQPWDKDGNHTIGMLDGTITSGQVNRFPALGRKVTVNVGGTDYYYVVPYNAIKKGTNTPTSVITDDTLGYEEDTLQHDRRVKAAIDAAKLVLDAIKALLEGTIKTDDDGTQAILNSILTALGEVTVTWLTAKPVNVSNTVNMQYVGPGDMPVSDSTAATKLQSIIDALAATLSTSDSTAAAKLQSIIDAVTGTLTIAFAAAQHVIVDSGSVDVGNTPDVHVTNTPDVHVTNTVTVTPDAATSWEDTTAHGKLDQMITLLTSIDGKL